MARRRRLRLAGLVLAGLGSLSAIAAGPGIEPRTQNQIAELLGSGPHAGECTTCHSSHSEDSVPYAFALVGPDDNSLCDDCHDQPWKGESYPDTWLYLGSSHGSSEAMAWPGPEPPARSEAGASGKCVNCHDPHGWEDGMGATPSLTVAREEALCMTCHDGHPAALDLTGDLLKPFRHPVTDFSGRHTGPNEHSPTDFGAAPADQRHAECEDCHNPHVGRADPPIGPVAEDALSWTNLGVSRVRVQNGPAGTPPSFLFTPASDTLSAPVAEYQLCFKCHSSWTVQPSGQTDLALALNPANPSYHPVEGRGRNLLIDSQAFTLEWNANSIVRCGDCHGSDLGSARGPHGSNYPGILKRSYTASPLSRMTMPDELCFECHAYDVYANKDADVSVLSASRFNPPAVENGHAKHVDDRQVPCYACHVTHGSTTQPFLLVVGRSPGLTSYTATPSGGTCSTTCHDQQSYPVNYAR